MSDRWSKHSLADEHAVLRREVDQRSQGVLAALTNRCRWPDAEIDGLLRYLRYEVLDQAVNEGRLLYPLAPGGFADERIRQLTEDHVHLRDIADALAVAARADPRHRHAQRLTATLEDLQRLLERHLDNEQKVLGEVAQSGIDPLRRPFRSHEWFPVTEGPVIDLDQLAREFAPAAAIDRLTRMRPGDHLEVRSGDPLTALHKLFTRRRLSSGYGWAYLEEGPQRWRATITRRRSSQ
jgi:uncharacterized protein (DUF2249 family)/hemerythrin-like domain-containing protein